MNKCDTLKATFSFSLTNNKHLQGEKEVTNLYACLNVCLCEILTWNT